MTYTVTYKMNDEVIGKDEIGDPLVRGVVNISWLDRFKSLFSTKDFVVEMDVDADPATTLKIINIDKADWSKVFVTGSAVGEASEE